ncbi:MAG: tetratricopeptide repeat protein [Armatimonadota bacterium]
MTAETSQSTSQPGGESAESDHRTYSDLAEVNLLRMRGQYEEAVRRCTDLLRQRPDDAVLHSLIGDIYSDQGSIEEAMQWYRMALDLDPASAYAKEKLERLEHLALVGKSQAQGLDWWRWTILAIASAILAVGVGTGWAIWSSRNTHPSRADNAPPPAQATPPGLDVRGARTPKPSAQSPQVFATPQIPAQSASPSQPTQGQDVSALTALEAHLLDLLSRSIQPEVSERSSVRSLTIDPRSHTAIVSMYCVSPPASPQDLDALVADARATALWTLSLAPDLRLVTVRVLSRFAQRFGVSGPAEIVFIGDLYRDRVDVTAPPTTNPFTSQWWNPRLAAAVPQNTRQTR